METTMGRAYLPEWLQTEEQQMAFLKELEPETLKNPVYHVVDREAIHHYLFEGLLPHLAEHGYALRQVRVDVQKINKYLDYELHLPEFMVDFHDAKSFFKYMHQELGKNEISWVKEQSYTIDIFLRNCFSAHQCKLAGTLEKGEFKNLCAAIREFEKNRE